VLSFWRRKASTSDCRERKHSHSMERSAKLSCACVRACSCARVRSAHRMCRARRARTACVRCAHAGHTPVDHIV
jgi:hypothetical protein